MAVRCYIPTTLAALAAGLSSAAAVAPDAAAAGLRGEELEEREFIAMDIAASLAATEALAAGGPRSARVVVAYDAPDSADRQPLGGGCDLLALSAVDMDAVASVHLDEEEVWAEALTRDPESAAAGLADSPLLWYDRSELEDLLRDRA